jgi:hypothetical protein
MVGGVDKTTRRQAVLVLGMHRSGTSALAGVVARLGAALPKTQIRSVRFNAKGYGESTVIVRFNDSLLASTGSDWRDFEQFDPHWMASPFAAAYASEARRLIDAEFGDAPVIVLKDPRICRMAPFWLAQLESLGFETYAVLSVRNPLEVAASLERRDGITQRIALLLWLRHVLDAEAATRHLPRAWVKYDELLADWRDVIGRVGRKLDLGWLNATSEAQAEVDQFLSAELRHHATSEEELGRRPELSDWVKKTYAAINTLRDMEVEPAERVMLDHIRSSLNTASEAFSPLIAGELRRCLRDMETFSRALSNAQVSNARLEARLQISKQKLEDYKRSIGRLNRLLWLPVALWQRIKSWSQPRNSTLAQKPTTIQAIAPSVRTPATAPLAIAPSTDETGIAFRPDPLIAVVCHVYYLSLWPELAHQVRQLTAPYDLYVTIVDQPGAVELANLIREENPGAKIEIVQNRGRDILPFLRLLNNGALDKYYLVCKLHTKKSPHREDGDAWRQRIFFSLLDSPKNVADIIRGFNADPALGLVVADGELYEGEKGWKGNRRRSEELAQALGIRLEDYPARFAFASIFWTRASALAPLRKLALPEQAFEAEQNQVDGTTAHAIERLFSILAMAQGLNVIERSQLR